ncbi:MAG: hypothetical protein P794_10010 [Epsilonproteobacteria bacterium (ex Lamellibrachia satsuma)]|nr:MAG: hypothetical protein P794_10010 [Epsilonproteobacteria bacterium (ex Lamellibrachia satsuma)]
MKLMIYSYQGEWNMPLDSTLDSEKTLVIVFGTSKKEKVDDPIEELLQHFPNSKIVGASTAGEILQDELLEESIVVAVMQFDTTRIEIATQHLSQLDDSYSSGVNIANALKGNDLKAVFVLSDGLLVNGSKLTQGIASVLSKDVVVTGGLAGDDDRFKETWVIAEGKAVPGYITGVGLYGDHIHISHGSKGGWDRLGMERVVTKSKDNILYELDGQPALDIYKKYLGDKADGLPATGLLFPLELKADAKTAESKVRTILAVDEKEKSITFAGDIPEGSYVTLMKTNYDRLIDGAEDAAKEVFLETYNNETILSIAISCVGRRLVLKQRIEEELEATLDVLPDKTKQIGFYSYGEISPLASGTCDLHNQTMTLTLIWEDDASPA